MVECRCAGALVQVQSVRGLPGFVFVLPLSVFVLAGARNIERWADVLPTMGGGKLQFFAARHGKPCLKQV